MVITGKVKKRKQPLDITTLYNTGLSSNKNLSFSYFVIKYFPDNIVTG
jgi:hypothetical protein